MSWIVVVDLKFFYIYKILHCVLTDFFMHSHMKYLIVFCFSKNTKNYFLPFKTSSTALCWLSNTMYFQKEKPHALYKLLNNHRHTL